MPQKDIGEKILIDYSDVFASIVNVFFKLNGYEDKALKVRPEDLKDIRGWSFYKAADKLRDQERDSVKLWTAGDAAICLMGIENQTRIDYNIPLRVFGYEGADYRNQLDGRNKNKPKHPVITIVLYYGTEQRWTAPKTLFERLKLPDWMRPFVNDIHVNVLELAWLTKEQEKFFCNDMQAVINFLRQMRENKYYVPDPIELIHYQAVINLLQTFTGDRQFETALLKAMDMEKRGERIMLPKVLSQMWDQAEQKGVAQGIAQGVTQGRIQMLNEIKQEMLLEGISPLTVESIINKLSRE